MWAVFLVVATGVFLSTMDSSMVNIALPAIMAEFQAPLKATEWVVLIYLLTITASLLLWGHLSDRFGRRRLYSLGLFGFATGSFACCMAQSLALLVFFRFWQAVGAAMMMSTGPAVIKDVFPESRLGRGLGMIGVAVSFGLMAGPSIGGFLLEFFSWRAIFLVTVPIALPLALFAWFLLPGRTGDLKGPEINWPSVLAWILGLAVASYSLTYGASAERSIPVLTALGVIVFLTMSFFVYQERRSQKPFIPPHLIKERFFFSAIVCALLSFLLLFSVLIMMPFFLDRVQGLKISMVGLLMMSLPLTVLLVAPLAGWLADYFPAKFISTAGLVCSTSALFWFSTLSVKSSTTAIVARLVLLGCGQGMFLAPNSASVLHRVAKKDSAKSAALLATARNMGMLLGIGQATLVFSFFFSQLTGNLDMKDYSPEHSAAFMAALNKVFQAAAIVGIFGVLISWSRDGGINEK